MIEQVLQVPTLKKPTKTSVSIIIPVYNESESVFPLFKELLAVCDTMDCPYELVFVDDGSSDNTVDILTQIAAEFPNTLKVIELRRNYGQTAAMAAGFAQSTGDVFVTLDGDLQNDPQDIPLLIQRLLESDADMVVGWRQKRQDAIITRKIPSWIANRIIGAMTGVKFRDYGCSLKAYKRTLAQEIPLYGELHRFIPVLASMEGARIEQVPVSHRARKFGKSKYTLSRTFKVILDLGMLLFMKRFFTRPLHMFGRLGIASSLLGLLILAGLTYEKLAMGMDIGNRPMLFLGMLLVITGIQLVSTGLLAELQIRTYFESQQKTPYKIRRIHG